MRVLTAWCVRIATMVAVVLVGMSGARGDTGLPVREVTVFKDGNAFVLREGGIPVTSDQRAVLTDLPNPVIGTFWPYAAQSGVTLRSVTAARRRSPHEHPALSLREMLAANVGERATIQEVTGAPYEATIVAVPHPEPSRTDDNPFVDATPDTPAPTPPSSDLLLLKTEQGIKAIPMDRVQEVTLPEKAKQTWSSDDWDSDLSLQLSGAKPGSAANVGVMYLARGMRWIPSYRVSLDGKGMAKIQLQATLINELTDLDDTTVNLVIGVPTFAFKDTPDPIGLQDTFARLSRYFQVDARTPGAFANAIMTQSRAGEAAYAHASAESADATGVSLPGAQSGEKAEDLFVFTVKNIHLKRYERMVVPITEFTIPYQNVYTAELLPSGMRTRYGYESYTQNNEALRLLTQPHVEHNVRFTNTSLYPLTTAPTLILRDGRVIAQGMMTYTPKGGLSDLALTDASDVTIRRADKETKRTPNALQADNVPYEQVDMGGTIELQNFRTEPVAIEVMRYVLGKADTANLKGTVSALDPYGDDTIPDWLGQYSNAADRLRFTGLGKVVWKMTLPPKGECITLTYDWHYFIR